MTGSIGFGKDKATASVLSRPKTEAPLGLKGHYNVICRDKDGNVKWEESIDNGITNVGVQHLLNLGFNNQSIQVATWYVGLINGSSATLANADTMSSHGGWTENTAYTEAARVEWVDVASSGSSRQIVNSGTTADFTINASSQTIYGVFLTSSSTKSGTSGTLFSTAAFSAAKSVGTDDVLQVTYTVSVT